MAACFCLSFSCCSLSRFNIAAILAPPFALTGGGARAAGVAGDGPSAELFGPFFAGVMGSFSLSLSSPFNLSLFEVARPILRGIIVLALAFFFDFLSFTLLV